MSWKNPARKAAEYALPKGYNHIGTVTIGDITPGTDATDLGKAIDSVAGATDTGVALLAVRDDALAGVTPAEGDYLSLLTDANGALWTHDDALDAALSGSGFNITQLGSAAVPIGAGLEATAVRVTLPTDGTGAVGLNAGSASIGTLGANSGVDIGDVDVLSVAIPSTFVYGQKTVTVAGTDEVLAGSNALVIGVTVKALAGNTDVIYVGLEGVAAATGFELSAGEQIFIPVTNTNLVWLDSAVSGEGGSFIGN